MKWIDCSDRMSQYDSVKDWYKGSLAGNTMQG